jgi:hypothetical protein
MPSKYEIKKIVLVDRAENVTNCDHLHIRVGQFIVRLPDRDYLNDRDIKLPKTLGEIDGVVYFMCDGYCKHMVFLVGF